MQPVLCTRGALTAAVAMAFAGSAFAGGPGINLPAPALQEGFSIHGLIDTGFQVHHANGTTSARMMPNGDETSAFHLRARENLDGGNYVRLKLSAPFKPHFVPLKPGEVGIYVCGATVQSSPHI